MGQRIQHFLPDHLNNRSVLTDFVVTITLMRDTRSWALWRRIQYGSGFLMFWVLIGTFVYWQYFFEGPTCFDGEQNAEERGVDCGGACERICAFDVTAPKVLWTQSFRVREGQYNVVSYVENRNLNAAPEVVPYTIKLYDTDGLILEQAGSTILPPDSVYPIFTGPVQTGDRIPTQNFLEFGEFDNWYPAEHERGRFSVGAQQLFNEDTRPRLEANLTNNELVGAENIEVVATIFDENRNALTSSRTFVEAIDPRSTERIVFTWPEPIAKTIRSCKIPTDVVLAIDLSGSMNNDQAEPPEPITSVKSAAQAFVERLRADDKVSVVTFATNALVDLPLAGDTAAASEVVRTLTIAPAEETGSTNTGEAFLRAAEEFTSARANPEARQVMVLLTDGLATAPGESPEDYAREQAERVKALGVEVFAIGLGEQVNMDFVRELATDRDHVFQAISRGQVNQIYEEITGDICQDGPAIIEIIPKSGVTFR